MANFASLRGPVGLNRVYVESSGLRDTGRWLEGLRRGRSFATNGPLVGLSIEGHPLGEQVAVPAGGELRFKAWLRSIVPVDHLEIVANGEVVARIELTGDRRQADAAGSFRVTRSGWCLLRAYADAARPPILDLYPYATTSPVYLTLGGAPTRSPQDAAYFVAWIDRLLEEARGHGGYNSDWEKQETLRVLTEARAFYLRQAEP
jgi:hypothetical protein